jgi:hypothetical protein
MLLAEFNQVKDGLLYQWQITEYNQSKDGLLYQWQITEDNFAGCTENYVRLKTKLCKVQ